MADLKNSLQSAGLVGTFGQVANTDAVQPGCDYSCTSCTLACSICALCVAATFAD